MIKELEWVGVRLLYKNISRQQVDTDGSYEI